MVKDSFPQSGGKPQTLLNEQFVNDCDLYVALLGTRFGTPTDNYDSGTEEEEIEIMLPQEKQVFLYFIERQVDHSKLDLDQLAKVKNFKDKYADKGIYSVIKSDEQFRKEFQNAITLYFLKTVSPTVTEIAPSFAPDLLITAECDETGTIFLSKDGYKDIKILEKKEKYIRDLIAVIDGFTIVPSETPEQLNIPKLTDEQKEHMTVGDIMKAMANGSISKAEYYTLFGQEPPVCKQLRYDLNTANIAILSRFYYTKFAHNFI